MSRLDNDGVEAGELGALRSSDALVLGDGDGLGDALVVVHVEVDLPALERAAGGGVDGDGVEGLDAWLTSAERLAELVDWLVGVRAAGGLEFLRSTCAVAALVWLDEPGEVVALSNGAGVELGQTLSNAGRAFTVNCDSTVALCDRAGEGQAGEASNGEDGGNDFNHFE